MGEELRFQIEEDNIFDEFVVAVFKDENIIGHVPQELARTCWYFLKKRYSSMTCWITGQRRLSEIDGKAWLFLVFTSLLANKT